MTFSKPIQAGLSLAERYVCTRTPEPILTHVDNARKQMKINFPVGIACNDNGDQFILDTGSACVKKFLIVLLLQKCSFLVNIRNQNLTGVLISQ